MTAKTLEVNTMNALRVTEKTAGTESTAKIKSVVSTSTSTSASGVRASRPLNRVRNFWPSKSGATGKNFRTNRSTRFFSGCTISGAVDFIFGGATSFFDHCQIRCLGNGYITAASTPSGQAFGLVFADCTIGSEGAGTRTYLGRPWRPFAHVAFLNTEMSLVVSPAGWHNWNKPESEKTAYFAEFGSSGQGGDAAQRVPWAHRLSRAEAERITAARVLGGSDGWNPSTLRDQAAPQGSPDR